MFAFALLYRTVVLDADEEAHLVGGLVFEVGARGDVGVVVEVEGAGVGGGHGEAGVHFRLTARADAHHGAHSLFLERVEEFGDCVALDAVGADGLCAFNFGTYALVGE